MSQHQHVPGTSVEEVGGPSAGIETAQTLAMRAEQGDEGLVRPHVTAPIPTSDAHAQSTERVHAANPTRVQDTITTKSSIDLKIAVGFLFAVVLLAYQNIMVLPQYQSLAEQARNDAQSCRSQLKDFRQRFETQQQANFGLKLENRELQLNYSHLHSDIEGLRQSADLWRGMYRNCSDDVTTLRGSCLAADTMSVSVCYRQYSENLTSLNTSLAQCTTRHQEQTVLCEKELTRAKRSSQIVERKFTYRTVLCNARLNNFHRRLQDVGGAYERQLAQLDKSREELRESVREGRRLKRARIDLDHDNEELELRMSEQDKLLSRLRCELNNGEMKSQKLESTVQANAEQVVIANGKILNAMHSNALNLARIEIIWSVLCPLIDDQATRRTCWSKIQHVGEVRHTILHCLREQHFKFPEETAAEVTSSIKTPPAEEPPPHASPKREDDEAEETQAGTESSEPYLQIGPPSLGSILRGIVYGTLCQLIYLGSCAGHNAYQTCKLNPSCPRLLCCRVAVSSTITRQQLLQSLRGVVLMSVWLQFLIWLKIFHSSSSCHVSIILYCLVAPVFP